MKWLKDPLKDKLGDKRIIEKFLFIPVCIDGIWRWLEKVRIMQEVMRIDVGGSMEWGKYKHKYKNIAWMD